MATTPSDPLTRIRARAGELIARDRWNRAQVEEHVRDRLTALLDERRHYPAHLRVIEIFFEFQLFIE